VSFPHEDEPDGEVGGPHHAYIGLGGYLVAMLGVLSSFFPAVGTVAAFVAWFGFQYVWPFYAPTGAALALGGVSALLVATLATAPAWVAASPLWFVVALLGALVALDDVLEHALEIATPVDRFWKSRLAPALPSTP